jgi:ribosome-binding protein aMBF1 (putative translation factor)
MTVVLAAREAFEQAQKDAKASVDRARAGFGKTIKDARVRDGASQEAIRQALGLTREQVRRYERFYETWREANGEP